MIKIEEYEVLGFDHAIRAMRNPSDGWNESDSGYLNEFEDSFIIGKNDLYLMKRLVKAGANYRKFMKMIIVYCDIVAPLYWWKRFDDFYKVETERIECSILHRTISREFIDSDFSHEHLCGFDHSINGGKEYLNSNNILDSTIYYLNSLRDAFLETNDPQYCKQIIQLLPNSYNQRATLKLDYEVLCKIYYSANHSGYDEWREFRKWIESLPYSEIITSDN